MRFIALLISLVFVQNVLASDNVFPHGTTLNESGEWGVNINTAEGEVIDFSFYTKDGKETKLTLNGAYSVYSFKAVSDRDSITFYLPGTTLNSDNVAIRGIYEIEITQNKVVTSKLYSEFSQFLEFIKNYKVSGFESDLPDISLEKWLKSLFKGEYKFEWSVNYCDHKTKDASCVFLSIRYKDRGSNIAGYTIQIIIMAGSYENGIGTKPKLLNIDASRVKNYKWFDKQKLNSLRELKAYTNLQ